MLQQTLQVDLKKALLERNTQTLQTIRFLMSQLKNKEIDKKSELTDDDIIQIIKKQVKELEVSAEMFKNANRPELVDENMAQVAILKTYLPAELSDTELEEAVKKVVEENKEAYEKNPKSLMGITVSKLKSQADAQRILAVLKKVVPEI